MSNVENGITVGIIGKNQATIDVFRESFEDSGMGLRVFQSKKELLMDCPPDILILSERTGLRRIKHIPRIILGQEKENNRIPNGAAARALNNGALDYVYSGDKHGKNFAIQDIADYTVAKISRFANRRRACQTPAQPITIREI